VATQIQNPIGDTEGEMSYDRKCRDLAIEFLDDHYDPIPETAIDELAQVIQDAIEDWLRGEGK